MIFFFLFFISAMIFLAWGGEGHGGCCKGFGGCTVKVLVAVVATVLSDGHEERAIR